MKYNLFVDELAVSPINPSKSHNFLGEPSHGVLQNGSPKVDERMFAAVERRASAARRAVDGASSAGVTSLAAEATAGEALEALEAMALGAGMDWEHGGTSLPLIKRL
jgi:hypothetical protein